MTTPYERTRALRQAGELLELLAKREDIPADIRTRAQGALRHYPENWVLEAMAEEWQTFTGDKTFGLAPESEGQRG